ncbi:MAG: serine/threonine protein kinase [Myxococcales bacterium]|nr:serine/threonine protein kinase [Myxococcales bacterium]
MARGTDDTPLGAQDSGIAATLSAAHADSMSSGVWKPEAPEPRRGDAVGRYVVLGRLGAGGALAAYDPELDHKVALKLLRDETSRDDGKGRLLREAQALAKLSHPNVVAVHDAGTFEDRVYLAMEHVAGRTLRSWLQDGRRWQEVLAALTAAGRGLAAAHAAGLVHRDVKPDSVMVGADGRVRVTDFGLARPTNGRASISSESLTLSGGERLGVSATRTGAPVGTPAYMAPEQWIGKEADARSDQFAFCVTMWEALYGQRPFVGDSLATLAPRVLKGELQAPPRGSTVPGWLRRVLARGLQAEPQRRHPSMSALLAALGRGQTRGRRVWLAAGVLGLMIAGAGVAAWRTHQRGLRARACEAAGGEIAAAWQADARAGLEHALRASGLPHAEATFVRVVPWIDRWAAEWSRVRAQVCREAMVEETRPPGELTTATACLDERRDELAGLLTVLGDGDPASAAQAVPAVAGLTSPATCADPRALARRPAAPIDGDTRAQVGSLRRDLMRVRGLLAAGRVAEGFGQADVLLAAAERLGHRPLEIEARLTFGRLALAADQPARAEQALAQVYFDAGALGADEPARLAATALVRAVGVAAARPAEGLVWARSAAMLVARLGLAGTLADAEVVTATATVHALRGAHDEALPQLERALAIAERVLGPSHPGLEAVLTSTADVQRARGELAAAARLLARAVAIDEEALGPESPQVARALVRLAAVHRDARDLEAARGALERALAIAERALGERHPDVAGALVELAAVLLDQGATERAVPLYDRALAVQEQALGPAHPDVARTLHSLAVVHGRLGEHLQAVALHRRALAAREEALGPDHAEVLQSLDDLTHEHRGHGELALAAAPAERALALRERTLGPSHTDLARALEELGVMRRELGELEPSERLLTRALAMRLALQGPRHREVATSRVLLGETLLARGRAKEAADELEAALAGLGGEATAPALLADARFALARALGRRHARAAALTREAIAGYEAAGAGAEARLRAARAWLDG